MKYSTVDGERHEAEKGLVGNCIGCGGPMIPKCGPKKVPHWGHRSLIKCDHWWENETRWHRDWKNNFPVECQEIRHKAENGEWHIADVKTKQGYILEFQHSFLNPKERQARNYFYKDKLIWVVDGMRRTRDRQQFDSVLKDSRVVNQSLKLIRLPFHLDECTLLEEWSEGNVPVFFDFGVDVRLWCLLPKAPAGTRYIGPFSRKAFIELLTGGVTADGRTLSKLMNSLNEIAMLYEKLYQQGPARQSVAYSGRGLNINLRTTRAARNPKSRYVHHLNRWPRSRG